MTERGIIFSAPMVKALLDGSKTQTRRVARSKGFGNCFRGKSDGRKRRVYNFDRAHDREAMLRECPYGVAGDRLWVRETWGIQEGIVVCERDRPNVAEKSGDIELGPKFRPVTHRAGREAFAWGMSGPPKWKSSRFMPKTASRITLELTGVRVERVQDISAVDVVAEGVTYPVSKSEKHPGKCSVLWNISSEFSPLNYIAKKDHGNHEKILIAHYASLWDSLHKKPPQWADNPWIWALSFKILS